MGALVSFDSDRVNLKKLGQTALDAASSFAQGNRDVKPFIDEAVTRSMHDGLVLNVPVVNGPFNWAKGKYSFSSEKADERILLDAPRQVVSTLAKEQSVGAAKEQAAQAGEDYVKSGLKGPGTGIFERWL